MTTIEGEIGEPLPARPRPVHLVMVDVMAEVGIIPKTHQHGGSSRFMFRGIEDVLAKLQPLLTTHDLLIVPEVLERIDLPGRVTDKGKAMHAVAVHVRYRVHGPAGDSLTFSAWGEGADTSDKATGKAMSMAYKTAMLQAFSVPTTTVDDADREDPSEAVVDPPREYTTDELAAAARALAAAREASDRAHLLRIGSAANAQGLMGAELDGATLRAHLDDLLELTAGTAPRASEPDDAPNNPSLEEPPS